METHGRNKRQKEGNRTQLVPSDDYYRMLASLCTKQGAMLFALMLSNLPPYYQPSFVKSPQILQVDMEGFSLVYFLSDSTGIVNGSHTMTFKYPQPLQTIPQIKSYFIQLRNDLLSPKLSWIMTDPFMRCIIPTVLLLGFCTHILGFPRLIAILHNINGRYPLVSAVLSATFGSVESFALAVRVSWYFTVIAHTLEATYVAYLCTKILQLRFQSVMGWFWLTCLVGYPSTRRVLRLVKYQNGIKQSMD